MSKFMGVSVVEAELCTWKEFVLKQNPSRTDELDEQLGYLVTHTDDEGEYDSWQDKESFEAKYPMQIGDANSITKELVESVVEKWEHTIVNDINGHPKTVIVMCRLKNGFTIVESSSCVDPKNFDVNIGIECCMDRIENKLWELLGFVLQCGTVNK